MMMMMMMFIDGVFDMIIHTFISTKASNSPKQSSGALDGNHHPDCIPHVDFLVCHESKR